MDEIDLIIYKIKEYYLNVIKKQNDLIEVQVDQINELKSQICKNQQTESELSTVNLKLNKELMDIKSQIPCEGSNSNQTQTNLFIENPKTYQLVEFAVVDQVQQQKLNKKFQIVRELYSKLYSDLTTDEILLVQQLDELWQIRLNSHDEYKNSEIYEMREQLCLTHKQKPNYLNQNIDQKYYQNLSKYIEKV